MVDNDGDQELDLTEFKQLIGIITD